MITQIYEANNFDEARSLVKAGVDYVGVLVRIEEKCPGELRGL